MFPFNKTRACGLYNAAVFAGTREDLTTRDTQIFQRSCKIIAVPMVPRMNSPSLLVLGVAALTVSSSFASKVTSAMRAPANDAVVIQEGRPYCEVMVPCNIPKCALLCAGNGLTSALGFCTMKPDYQVYCCCPVPNS